MASKLPVVLSAPFPFLLITDLLHVPLLADFDLKLLFPPLPLPLTGLPAPHKSAPLISPLFCQLDKLWTSLTCAPLPPPPLFYVLWSRCLTLTLPRTPNCHQQPWLQTSTLDECVYTVWKKAHEPELECLERGEGFIS